MKQILKNLYKVAMCILIGLALLSFIDLTAGICPRILVTYSMQPSVYKGNLVLLNINTTWEDFVEGNIMVFRSAETEVMQCVTTVTDDGLILRTDYGKG